MQRECPRRKFPFVGGGVEEVLSVMSFGILCPKLLLAKCDLLYMYAMNMIIEFFV